MICPDKAASVKCFLFTVKKKCLTLLLGCVTITVGDEMEEKVEQAYLYDFYGELLNEHQRRIYEDFVFNDLSLGEIANEEGISRQGVHDMIKRCTKALEGYEARLHLIEKFQGAKKRVEQIHALAGQFHQNHDEAIISEIEQISNQILEEL